MTELSIPDSRELFHATCAGVKFKRPPFWMMRQAGRYLPEYRALKERHGFLGIVKTPEVAVEAALQPMRRFDFDCAIIFSDILVVPEALGFAYKFKDAGGIAMERRVETEDDIRHMRDNLGALRENLSYVAENARLLRRALPKKAVLGFCGAPFTLAAYMVEGESSKTFPRFLDFVNGKPALFEKLLGVLEEALTDYLQMQMECGVDGVQIFDSHASLTPPQEYSKLSVGAIKRILDALDGRTRTIVFAPNMSGRFAEVARLGADVYSVGSAAKLSSLLGVGGGKYCLQGNLAPEMLSGSSPEDVFEATKKIVGDMLPHGRHIFNLGHGIRPDAKIENVEAMCRAVKSFENA